MADTKRAFCCWRDCLLPQFCTASFAGCQRCLADPGDGSGVAPEEMGFLKILEGRKLQSVNPSETPRELITPRMALEGSHQPRPLACPQVLRLWWMGCCPRLGRSSLRNPRSPWRGKNEDVDPMLTIPMTQDGCIPSEEGTDIKP